MRRLARFQQSQHQQTAHISSFKRTKKYLTYLPGAALLDDAMQSAIASIIWAKKAIRNQERLTFWNSLSTSAAFAFKLGRVRVTPSCFECRPCSRGTGAGGGLLFSFS